MLTVAEALKLRPFAEARIVAGHAGLDHVVSWVHNVGVPDAAEWLNGGELVLTTALNMPLSTEEQKHYLRDLAAKKIAGLVITTGRYIENIPDFLYPIADEVELPLIEIPFQVRFVDIAKAINEHISEQNMAMVQRALHIHQRLTQLVLEVGNFDQLATMLAELVGHSISIENERFEAIASENIAEVDEARRYTLLHGRTNPLLVEALEDKILPEIRRTLRPVHIPKKPHVGLEMERILAPIVVHGEIYGYMWIIADNHALSEIDRMAIESGSMIAALMMLYQESVQSAEATLKGNLLSKLIQGDVGSETILTDQSLRYGVDVREEYVMLMLEFKDNGGYALYRQVNQLINTEGFHAVAGQFAGQVIVLAQASESSDHIAQHLCEHIQERYPTVRVGVSHRQQGVACVTVAHQQCLDVLEITRRLHSTDSIVYFNQLGYLHTLYTAGADSLHSNPSVPLLRPLLHETHAELFDTLEVYLDTGGNGVQTADKLHIHRSTLNYRLGRISELCQVSLTDATTRTNLQVAVKLLRLFGGEVA